MDASTIVAIVSTAVAAIIAVSVPYWTFRLALRQDHGRWVREQRAQLYTDLVVEAYAEQQHLEYVLLDEAVRKRVPDHVDLRLPPLERARLGTRANLLGSQAVKTLFGRLEAEGLWARVPIGREINEGDRIAARVRLGRLLDELSAQVRRELGADAFDAPARIEFREPHPSERFIARLERQEQGRAPGEQRAESLDR